MISAFAIVVGGCASPPFGRGAICRRRSAARFAVAVRQRRARCIVAVILPQFREARGRPIGSPSGYMPNVVRPSKWVTRTVGITALRSCNGGKGGGGEAKGEATGKAEVKGEGETKAKAKGEAKAKGGGRGRRNERGKGIALENREANRSGPFARGFRPRSRAGAGAGVLSLRARFQGAGFPKSYEMYRWRPCKRVFGAGSREGGVSKFA